MAEGGEELEHGWGDGLRGLKRVSWVGGEMDIWGVWGEGEFTPRAGVRVPSTSKRQMVFLTGRSSKGGYMAAA